jgi:diguanylate cyclase (GGDEF)-like protein
MEKILIVEDSRILASLLKASIEHNTDFEAVVAPSFAQAMTHLMGSETFFACVTDLNLPDAEPGAFVDTAIGAGLPTIVYTGDYSDELRERIWKKKIVDYILKRDPDSSLYISRLVQQLGRNRDIDIIVVDDSSIIRNSIKKLLETHLFRVHAFGGAVEALAAAEKLPALRMIISDYMMPDMDGFLFAREIRKKHPKDKVAFIGISASQSEQIAAKFIKFGANDFLMKPFGHEQFYTRVNQNIQTLILIESIRDLAFKDYLTGLYNRRYFFLEMDKKTDNAEKTIAMMDIDFFKKVNDTYGHDGGDIVLKKIAAILKQHVGSDGFVSRFGGEEFCVYLDRAAEHDYFEEIRKTVESAEIDLREKTISVTISIGAVCSKDADIDAMIKKSDELLYEAKSNGRNRVCISR